MQSKRNVDQAELPTHVGEEPLTKKPKNTGKEEVSDSHENQSLDLFKELSYSHLPTLLQPNDISMKDVKKIPVYDLFRDLDVKNGTSTKKDELRLIIFAIDETKAREKNAKKYLNNLSDKLVKHFKTFPKNEKGLPKISDHFNEIAFLLDPATAQSDLDKVQKYFQLRKKVTFDDLYPNIRATAESSVEQVVKAKKKGFVHYDREKIYSGLKVEHGFLDEEKGYLMLELPKKELGEEVWGKKFADKAWDNLKRDTFIENYKKQGILKLQVKRGNLYLVLMRKESFTEDLHNLQKEISSPVLEPVLQTNAPNQATSTTQPHSNSNPTNQAYSFSTFVSSKETQNLLQGYFNQNASIPTQKNSQQSPFAISYEHNSQQADKLEIQIKVENCPPYKLFLPYPDKISTNEFTVDKTTGENIKSLVRKKLHRDVGIIFCNAKDEKFLVNINSENYKLFWIKSGLPPSPPSVQATQTTPVSVTSNTSTMFSAVKPTQQTENNKPPVDRWGIALD